MSLILCCLLALYCRREPELVVLIQNRHQGLNSVGVRVSVLSRSSEEKDSKVLWSGSVPFSSDPRLIYTRSIRFPGIAADTSCCVRIQLSYKGDDFSDGNGSWHSGTNYNWITIQEQNGIYVRHEETRDIPDVLADFKVVPLN